MSCFLELKSIPPGERSREKKNFSFLFLPQNDSQNEIRIWKISLHSISLSSITITTQIILAESSFLDNLWVKSYMVMENANRQQDDVTQLTENGYPLARGHSFNFQDK